MSESLTNIFICSMEQDYDWRQYVSTVNNQDPDVSLRTRLASNPSHPSPHPDTVSSGFEDTLSESMVCQVVAT